MPAGGSALGPAQPERLRILSANLYYRAADQAETLRALRSSGADLIGLVEVTPGWRDGLKSLSDIYPYAADCFDVTPRCEHMLLSKAPFVEKRSAQVLQSGPVIAGGDVVWNGHVVTVLVTHLAWPLLSDERPLPSLVLDANDVSRLNGALPAIRQVRQADALARALADMPPDVVLMGDLNSAPWSRVQRAFRMATGLENRSGWAPTWPTWLPWMLRLPLDHILARGSLAVTSFASGVPTDSDHLPVIAEIGWVGE